MPQHTSPVDTAAGHLAHAALIMAAAPGLREVIQARILVERAAWEMEHSRGDGPVAKIVRLAVEAQRAELDDAIDGLLSER